MLTIYRNIKYIFSLLIKHSKSYIIGTLFFSLFSILDPIIDVLSVKIILDKVTNGSSLMSIFMTICIFVFLMLFGSIISIWFNNSYLPRHKQKLKNSLNKLFFEKVRKVDMEHFDNPDYYDSYIRAFNQADNHCISVFDTIADIIGNFLSLTTLITIIIFLDPLIIGISVLTMILTIIISLKLNKINYKQEVDSVTAHRKQDYVNRIYYLNQFAKELRVYSLHNIFVRILNNSSNELIRIINKYKGKKTIYSLVQSLLQVIFIFGTLTYLSLRVYNKQITVGDFAALLSGSQQLTQMLSGFFNFIPKLQEHSLYINDLTEFLSHKNSVIENNILSKKDYKTGGDIILKNISFKYPNKKEYAIKDVTLHIKNKQKVALVGKNGAGKTTLVKLLLRLYDPIKGEIYYNNENIKNININKLRENIGVVFQDYQSYSLSIGENVLMKEIEKKYEKNVWNALKQSGLYNKVKRLPKGIYTTVNNEFDKNGVQLSGGELQKLALARAFANKFDFIILDEPSSSLDPIAEDELYKKLLNITNNNTALLISHRLSTIKMADYIYLLDEGKIIEEGTHESLMKLNGEYERMFTMQSEKYIINKPKDRDVEKSY